MRKVRVKCRLCSAFLLSEKSIVNQDGAPSSCADKEIPNSPQFCETQLKTHLFLQVDSLPEWVTAAVTESLYTNGKITCPKCRGRLGSFNFRRQSCGCGCKKLNVSPIHLLRDRVDVIQLDFATNAKAATPNSSCVCHRPGLIRGTGNASSTTELQEGKQNCLAAFAELNCNSRLDDVTQNVEDKLFDEDQDLNAIENTHQMLARTQDDCDEGQLHLRSLLIRDRDKIHTFYDESSVEERPFQQPCIVHPNNCVAEEEHNLSSSQKIEISCKETECGCIETCIESALGHVSHRISDWHCYKQHTLDDVHRQTLNEDTNETSCQYMIRKYSNASSCERHLHEDIYQTESICLSDVKHRDSHDLEKMYPLSVQYERNLHSPDSVDVAVQTSDKDLQAVLPISQAMCSKSSMCTIADVCKHHGYTPSHSEKCHILSACSLDKLVFLNSNQHVSAGGEDCRSPDCKQSEEPPGWGKGIVKGKTHSCRDIGQVRVPLPHRNCQQASSCERNSSIPNSQHCVPKSLRKNKKRTCSVENDYSALGSLHVCLSNSISSSGYVALRPTAAPDDTREIGFCEAGVEEAGGFKMENRFQALQDSDSDCGSCRLSQLTSTTQILTEKTAETGYYKFLSAGSPAASLTGWKASEQRMEEARAREVSILESEEVLPEFTCAVCLEVMLSPHTTLPCKHDFCSSCLRRLAVSSPVGTKCPLCRNTIIKCIPNSRLSKTIQKKYPVHVRARKRLEKRSFRNSPLPGSFLPHHLLQHLRSSRGARGQLGASRRKLVFLAFNILMVIMLSALGMVICRHVLAFVEEALDTVMEKLTGEKLWSEFMGVESRIATVSTVFVLYLVSAWMVRFLQLFRQIEN